MAATVEEWAAPRDLPSKGTPFLYIPSPVMQHDLLASMLVYAAATGMVGVELLGSLQFDIKLFLRPGWRVPSKVASRSAYLISRYAAFTFALLVVLFETYPGIDCDVLPKVFDAMVIISHICTTFVFAIRCVAICRSSIWVQCFVFFMFLYTSGWAISLCLIPRGINLPGSPFCLYLTKGPTVVVPLGWLSSTIAFDTTTFVLTANKLGALRLVWRDRLTQGPMLTKMLFEQGLLYFIASLCLTIGSMLIYTLGPDDNIKFLETPILIGAQSMLAGRVFRLTWKLVGGSGGDVYGSSRNKVSSQSRLRLPHHHSFSGLGSLGSPTSGMMSRKQQGAWGPLEGEGKQGMDDVELGNMTMTATIDPDHGGHDEGGSNGGGVDGGGVSNSTYVAAVGDYGADAGVTFPRRAASRGDEERRRKGGGGGGRRSTSGVRAEASSPGLVITSTTQRVVTDAEGQLVTWGYGTSATEEPLIRSDMSDDGHHRHLTADLHAHYAGGDGNGDGDGGGSGAESRSVLSSVPSIQDHPFRGR